MAKQSASQSEEDLANKLQADWTPESERPEEEEGDRETEGGSDIDPKELERLREESRAFQQLAQDEQISSLVQARNQGKQVEILTKEELEELKKSREQNDDDDSDQTEGPDVNDDTSIEELSNAELMRRTQQETLKSVEQLLNQKLEPVQEKLGQVDSIEQDRQRERVNQQVEQARAKYEDFEEYRKSMLELSRKHPTLSVEQLYWQAKIDSGALETANEKPDQEKPTGGGAASNPRDRGVSSQQRNRDPGNNRKSFQSLLQETLEG